MSKAAKRSLFILIILLLATLGFAAYSVIEKQQVEGLLEQTQKELVETRDTFKQKEREYMRETQELNKDLKKAGEEKGQLENRIAQIEKQAEEQIAQLNDEVREISGDRDKWKRRIDTIRDERDKLLARIDELTKKLEEQPEPEVVYKDRPATTPAPTPAPVIRPPVVDTAMAPSTMEGKITDEAYWAGLLQQKASLEVDLQKLKQELSEKSIEVVELRQTNEDLQLKVDALAAEREKVEIEIRHKADMLDNISLELARTKNDKKFVEGRVEKLNAENQELRGQLKQLVSVKNALEKSVVKLTQERDKVSGELGKTETIIQSKIDEIWDIKEDLDRSIREAQTEGPASEVELPPIVVSSNGDAMSYNTGGAPGFDGKVLSVNEANNFVIVNIGENEGIRLGDALSVYRDSKYIARLEVIQVRKDIAAADLKDQWSKVKVGDVVR